VISKDILKKCIFSHGLVHLFGEEGCEGYAGQKSPGTHENFSDDALPKNSFAQPPDPQGIGYERYVGYEVMQDNLYKDLQENDEVPEREPGCDDE
jgi:hypothetical protein